MAVSFLCEEQRKDAICQDGNLKTSAALENEAFYYRSFNLPDIVKNEQKAEIESNEQKNAGYAGSREKFTFGLRGLISSQADGFPDCK